MNKADLVGYVAQETGLTKKDSRKAINAVLDGIIEGLVADGKVTLVGFGVYNLVKRGARMARNPKTGEAVEVPAKVVPRFKASLALKAVVEDVDLDFEDDEDGADAEHEE